MTGIRERGWWPLGGRANRFTPGLAVLFFLAWMLLPGCGSDAGSDGGKPAARQITFLTMQLRPTFDAYFHTLFQTFEASHPGVKINWLDIPYQNYETKLMTSFLGNNPPDVVNLGSEVVPQWAEGGFIVALDDLVPSRTLAGFVSNTVNQGCRFGGKTYALPWYLSTAIELANRKIFEEAGIPIEAPPLYYDDLPAIARTIQEKTGKFGCFPLYTEAGSMRGWLMDAGIPMVSDDGKKAVFYTPRAVEIVTFWTDLYKKGLVPSEALTAMHRRPIELYKSGRLAVFHSGTEFLKQVKSDAPEVYENSLLGPQLQWKGTEVHTLSFHVLALAAKSRNPTLAAEFAAYVTNAQNQLAFCKLTTIVPSAVDALKDPYFTNPENTKEGQARKIAAQQVTKGSAYRAPKNSKKLPKVLDEITEAICLGKMTPDQGVKKAAEEWTRILNE